MNESNFTVEEREKLIAAVGEQIVESELIDWQTVAEDEFKGKYTGQECVYEFLKLPITESLNLNIESNNEQAQKFRAHEKENSKSDANLNLDQSQQFQDEFRAKGTTSVFMDASNPLLSQVAIFARLLEMSELGEIENDDEKKDEAGGSDEDGQPAKEEKRTTRGARKKKDQESSQ